MYELLLSNRHRHQCNPHCGQKYKQRHLHSESLEIIKLDCENVFRKKAEIGCCSSVKIRKEYYDWQVFYRRPFQKTIKPKKMSL